MRLKEDYSRFLIVALILTVAVLISFEIYILREPVRVVADEAIDSARDVSEGQSLFNTYCTLCHGKQGEGVDGPPLNDKQFLAETGDQTIFSLISSGVPATQMPAWNQMHGGPLTDQQVSQIVAFIRNWQPNAPDRRAEALQGDPANGLVIFSSTCFICHGANGEGTDRAPTLNDPVKLAQFDDAWYINTITAGRPAQGMPTWGTVLSPEEIRDLVALLRAWERGETVSLPGPEEHLHEAVHMLGHGDLEAARQELEEAAKTASGDQLEAISSALAALQSGDTDAALKAIEEAEASTAGDAGDEHDMGGMEMPEDMPMAPGEGEARSALADLEQGLSDMAVSKLKVALVLAQGDLKEAIEHALEDLEAGKIDEAREVLQSALHMQP